MHLSFQVSLFLCLALVREAEKVPNIFHDNNNFVKQSGLSRDASDNVSPSPRLLDELK